MSSRASTNDFPLASTALLGLQARALAFPLVQVCAQILRDSCAWVTWAVEDVAKVFLTFSLVFQPSQPKEYV